MKEKTMSSVLKDKMPIGWYLKEADSLITKFMNQTLETYDIGRYHWQIMNNINTHDKVCKDLLYHQIHRFVNPAEYEEIFQSLIERNWVEKVDDNYAFTPLGKTIFLEVAAKHEANKVALTKGASEEEYLNTILFLEKMIVNLGGSI
ncbi:hypothetical protein DVR12_01545 [Chitinophaga silvatica]|uniref:MarR family transcriptional regulator n=1 Tax=Chitinophaga silvatica TaxID=2282649 RepID=A0A3E1YGI9_9BACT|nr:hypothetical protein [Chitinophaga silvatica]RFS26499.1 hypothetical protein DVR12_01545 [Chitinophaga silvatica]